MSRKVYVNGDWFDENAASVSVFDRGFLFADAVYEVAAVVDGKLIDYAGHAARLWRSLAELGIPEPVTAAELLVLHREAVDRNSLDEGLIYLQVTRGVSDRDFVIKGDSRPGFVMFTQVKSVVENPKFENGLRVRTVDDLRWGRRDVKTVQLLYSSLVKSEAVGAGLDDAILVQDGRVTEASSANVHVVDESGVLQTPPLSRSLLPGITRSCILRLAQADGLSVKESEIAADTLANAREVFITSATSFVLPVVEIDGRAVGDGRPGAVTRRMRELYIAEAYSSAI